MVKKNKVYMFEGSPFIYEGTEDGWALLREYPQGIQRKYHPDIVKNLKPWKGE